MYLIVRPKKGVPPQERVKEIVDCPVRPHAPPPDALARRTWLTGAAALRARAVRRPPLPQLFKDLRANKPAQLSKLVIAPGDLLLPGLGLDPAMAEEIRANASVVLHCAATVNFNERLKLALQLNVLSVQQLLAFARSFANLAAFVHVSTAFSNCDRLCIQETVYDPVTDPKALMAAVFAMDDATADRITPGLVGARPNTYTFTKSLAEAIVREDGKGLPVAIMRPSIIGAAWGGSVPGWQDNLNGPGGLYIAAAHGVLRVMKGDPWAISDIVPVDFCANIILAIGWLLGTTPVTELPAELPVFHCTCGSTNPISWGKQFEYCFQALEHHPLAKDRQPFIPASFNFQMNRTRLAVDTFIKHTIPALIVDAGLVLSGQKAIMRRLYAKLSNATSAYEFFTSHSWWWEYNNAQALAALMTPEDRETYCFDMTKIDWPRYLDNYWAYTMTFIKPDGPEKKAKDAIRARNMKIVLVSIVVAIVAVVLMVVLNPFDLPSAVAADAAGAAPVVATAGSNSTAVASRSIADFLTALLSW